MNRFRRRLVIPLAAVLMLAAPSFARAEAALPAPQTVIRADFETDDLAQIVAPEQAATALLTGVAGEVMAGQGSLKGDSRGSGAEWNEFFHSRDGLFKAHEAYRVSFDFKILAREPNAAFYALMRRKSGGGDAGWTVLNAAPGAIGHATFAFSAGHAPDYQLIIGIQHGGALSVDNLVIQTDPANRIEESALPVLRRTWSSPGHTTYYVDSRGGSDAHNGTSARRAWRSLARVNAGNFAAGDVILLRAGSRWTGFLAPGGSGKPGAPIRLHAYGTGAKPRLDGEGKTLAALYLFNAEEWEISGLEVTNQGRARAANRTGVQVKLEDFGTAHHIVLRDLDVHDVNGSNDKNEGGGAGILWSNGGAKVKSRFDDLRIEGCHLARTDRNGIVSSGYWARNDWFPSLRVVVRANVLRDIGGDGIVPIGCDGALIERNVIRGGRMRAQDYAAGIWPWSCDNTLVQFNDVSGMKGTKDGQGYDSDWNCRNSVFQYNLSRDNEGGFMLICNDGGAKMPWSIGNTGTVVRYNISQNDGEHTFNITGPCRDTLIYNNVFFIGAQQNIFAVTAGNWGGDWSENTRFYNNIFYVVGRAKFDLGGMRNTVFEHNAFRGTLENLPPDPAAVTNDFPLTAPGDVALPQGFAPLPGSPLLKAGRVVENNGGRDFAGNPLPPGAPSIGAFEVPALQPAAR